MDFLDYREKLNIGFNDEQRTNYLLVKVFNVLKAVCNHEYSECFDVDEYFTFCDITGTEMDYQISESCYDRNRLEHCISVLKKHTKNLPDFLSYYVAFVNAVKAEKSGRWKRKNFALLIVNKMDEAHIPYDLLEENGEYFIFPKGAKELDDALVSQPLLWLSDYPKAKDSFAKALKEYSEATADNASDVADKFRKALETFFQEFFGGGKSLENYKSEYGAYLKAQTVPKEISGNLEALMQAYTNFMNNYAKHHDATSDRVLEYLMYQTGNIIRLLITLKREELCQISTNY